MGFEKNVSTFIGCESEYDDSRIVIFGAPFDSTTSYRPGTRFGCKAIRSESFGLETYSPYQNKDLTECDIFDAGDLELTFGSPEMALNQIEELVDVILKDGKLPFMLGGEHLVTLGAVRAMKKKFDDLYILHFDAHTDLREDYLGEKLSHATVIRRCWELVGDKHIYQFGIRSGEREEFRFAEEHNILNKFNLKTVPDAVKALEGKNVYLTIDLDVLDPSVFPGTGTPEAGGADFMQLLTSVLELSKLNIVGADMNELSPIYDQSGASTAVACKMLRETLLALYK